MPVIFENGLACVEYTSMIISTTGFPIDRI